MHINLQSTVVPCVYGFLRIKDEGKDVGELQSATGVHCLNPELIPGASYLRVHIFCFLENVSGGVLTEVIFRFLNINRSFINLVTKYHI